MPPTRGAVNLGPLHEKRPILLRLDGIGACRLPEARPARARVVLRLGAEELGSAAGAAIRARLLRVPVAARERALGCMVPQHAVLLVRELALPFGVALLDLRRQSRHLHDQRSAPATHGSARRSGGRPPCIPEMTYPPHAELGIAARV